MGSLGRACFLARQPPGASLCLPGVCACVCRAGDEPILKLNRPWPGAIWAVPTEVTRLTRIALLGAARHVGAHLGRVCGRCMPLRALVVRTTHTFTFVHVQFRARAARTNLVIASGPPDTGRRFAGVAYPGSLLIAKLGAPAIKGRGPIAGVPVYTARCSAMPPRGCRRPGAASRLVGLRCEAATRIQAIAARWGSSRLLSMP